MNTPSIIKHWPGDEFAEATQELIQLADKLAFTLANHCRHVPKSALRELAEYIADGIDNALFDIGGRLDGDVFMARAGMGKGAAS